jgi:hypothetical protein
MVGVLAEAGALSLAVGGVETDDAEAEPLPSPHAAVSAASTVHKR